MKMFSKMTKGSQGLILAACLSALPQMVCAASSESSMANSSNLKIVPTLGYSYFNIQGSSSDYKSKGGNSVAVLAQMPMGGSVELESGLEYLETGAKQSVDFGFLSLDTLTVTIKQLTVPLRAKYIFNPSSSGTRWYGKGGVTPTFVMSASADVPGAGSTDIKSDLNTFGILAQAGLGADWGLESIGGRVNLDVTYSQGLTKVFKEDSGRAAGFQIAAGYAFSL